VVFPSGHRMVTDLQPNTAPLLMSMHNTKKENYSRLWTINSRNILTNGWINYNVRGTGHTRNHEHIKCSKVELWVGAERWVCLNMRFFIKRTWQIVQYTSKGSCAYGPHSRPKINQHAVYRIPLPCWPTMQIQASFLETLHHTAPICHFISWLKI